MRVSKHVDATLFIVNRKC